MKKNSDIIFALTFIFDKPSIKILLKLPELNFFKCVKTKDLKFNQ